MKRILIALFASYAVFQLEAANADFETVTNPTPGQKIYWTREDEKSSGPCAWYEVWEVLEIQNGVVKLKKVNGTGVSFTSDEHLSKLGKLKSWASEEEAKEVSDANQCHLKRKFDGK